MKINAYGISDTGLKRDHNEDSYLINEELRVYIVADGMGGHLGGEEASRIAVQTVEEALKHLEADPNQTLSTGRKIKDLEQEKLRHALRQASANVFKRAQEDTKLHGMGTTAVVLYFRNNKLYCANVGDSRAYLIKNGKVQQLTEDHSLVNEQVKAGLLSQDAAKHHQFKNIITRSIGFQESVEIDVVTMETLPGDRFLICSDGLTNMVEDAEIGRICDGKSLQQATLELVQRANEKGGDDNITVVLTEVAELAS